MARGQSDFFVFLTSASVWCGPSPRPSAVATRGAEVVGADQAAQPGHRREQRELERAERAVRPRLDVLLDVGGVEQAGEEEADEHGEEHRAGREAAPARPSAPFGQWPDGLGAVRRLRLEPLLPLLGRLVAVRRLVAAAPVAGGVLGRAPVVAAARVRAGRLVAAAARLALVPAVESVALRAGAVVPAPAGRAGARAELPHAPVARHLVGRRPRLLALRRPQVPDEEVVLRAGPRGSAAGPPALVRVALERHPHLPGVLAPVGSVVAHPRRPLIRSVRSARSSSVRPPHALRT